jgi:hypothetical protein
VLGIVEPMGVEERSNVVVFVVSSLATSVLNRGPRAEVAHVELVESTVNVIEMFGSWMLSAHIRKLAFPERSKESAFGRITSAQTREVEVASGPVEAVLTTLPIELRIVYFSATSCVHLVSTV